MKPGGFTEGTVECNNKRNTGIGSGLCALYHALVCCGTSHISDHMAHHSGDLKLALCSTQTMPNCVWMSPCAVHKQCLIAHGFIMA